MNKNGRKLDYTMFQNALELISNQIQVAVALRGKASLAVCGGSSPVELFQQMSVLDLNWSVVNVTLVDDRLVSGCHPDSNQRILRNHLFQNLASNANFIPLQALKINENLIQLPFDVVFKKRNFELDCYNIFYHICVVGNILNHIFTKNILIS